MGRPPKPTALKLVTGNPGKRPLNQKEPRPSAQMPVPPPSLDAVALEEWNSLGPELFALGIITRADKAVFAAYCESYSLYLTIQEQFRQSGNAVVIRTKSGNIIYSPILGALNKARAAMMKAAGELGITPSARSRISAEPPDDDDPIASRYFD